METQEKNSVHSAEFSGGKDISSYLSKLEQVLRVWMFSYKAPKYNGQAGHKKSRDYNSEEIKLGKFRFK